MQKVSQREALAPGRVAIIGPTYPNRGGVAQYNTQMYYALRELCKVDVISFRRLYPGFLYPGESDKEPDEVTANTLDSKQIIDAYWPPSLSKAANLVIQNKSDVAIITWWTLFWQPGLAYVARKLRRRGLKVVYICHNVFDHDANKLAQLISKRLLRAADGYIVHSADEKQRLTALYPSAKVLNTGVLPISPDFPRPKGSLSKRGRLELLFFGFIRPYKGLDILLEAIKLLPVNHGVYLTIVGEVWSDKELLKQNIAELAGNSIEAHLNYVSNQEAAEYFDRADVVVLPYKSATGSAVASQAFYYEKPILGTSVSGIKDVVSNEKTGWIVPPNSAKQLAKAIEGLDRNKAAATRQNIKKFNAEHGWDSVAKTYMDFVASV